MIEKENLLFDGDDSLFKEVIRDTNLYGEYGCGLSTDWVLRNSKIMVHSVDTSHEWVQITKNKNNKYLQRLNIKLIDLGEVGDWGRPINYNYSDIFYNYTDWIWKLPQIPDTVLIDGRFRVCCFLTSLKNAKQGTKIIFDDYCNRPYYHIVENYIQREVTYGRQCLFIVPSQKNINFSELDKDIKNFRFVMD